ncbi:bifunctional 2-polyprenyl-6-hydroxyphenol methylase/3-demethylubiquinol 3-O-methyltransferase UbiG [Geobacter sp. DSM 9736]|uniref:class I SAM-dependent methyltransferase n=1 Tax=Geobacter sp. DSM 9736 TaxID=1277350 RepID=UPI000B5026FD|nr:class I SAM-dependent methyltransferase [Geobacter sp. DSM 9736]SNB45401.1 Tellurite resistance protein TehB [Geobacter sp. DSM 9736]
MRMLPAFLLVLLFQAGTVQGDEPKRINTDNNAPPLSYYEDFNQQPNVFLMDMVRGMKPGKALDVAMGTGRNAVYLGTLGWDVTGFDISEMDIRIAVEKAREAGTKINTVAQDVATFDFGKNQWDLVVLSYVPFARVIVDKVHESLKPGGVVMLEFFHRDSLKMRLLAHDLTFADNELLQIFSKYRILHYEDVLAKQDWGLSHGSNNRLVRLWAQKKDLLSPAECTLEDRPYPEEAEVCWHGTKVVCSRAGWVTKAGKCG